MWICLVEERGWGTPIAHPGAVCLLWAAEYRRVPAVLCYLQFSHLGPSNSRASYYLPPFQWHWLLKVPIWHGRCSRFIWIVLCLCMSVFSKRVVMSVSNPGRICFWKGFTRMYFAVFPWQHVRNLFQNNRTPYGLQWQWFQHVSVVYSGAWKTFSSQKSPFLRALGVHFSFLLSYSQILFRQVFSWHFCFVLSVTLSSLLPLVYLSNSPHHTEKL